MDQERERERKREANATLEPAREAGKEKNEKPKTHDAHEQEEPEKRRALRGFVPELTKTDEVRYRREDQPKSLTNWRAAFVDRGDTIDVLKAKDKESVHAALELAAKKWGEVHVSGNKAFKEQVVKLAAEHGLPIKNPELQEPIRRERERLERARGHEMPRPQPAKEATQGQERPERKPLDINAGVARVLERHAQALERYVEQRAQERAARSLEMQTRVRAEMQKPKEQEATKQPTNVIELRAVRGQERERSHQGPER